MRIRMIMKTHSYYSIFLLVLCLYGQSQAQDWLLDNKAYKAAILDHENQITVENGLIERTFTLMPNAATTSFKNVRSGDAVIRGIKPEAKLTINGVGYNVGGLHGQANYAFLLEKWTDSMTADSADFQFVGWEEKEIVPHVQWKKTRYHHPGSSVWPVPGVHLTLHFASPKTASVSASVIVHYELYDGLPVICKWIEVINSGGTSFVLDDFSSEVLAAVEYATSVDTRNINVPSADIHVETDFAFGSMYADDANDHVVHWLPDPDYLTQVNYQRNNPCLLEVSPTVGPSQRLHPNDTFTSFRTYVLPNDSYDRERQGLEIRRMYRTIAPWTTENPLMMHVRYADWESVKTAIDQAAEVGFEMLILTFGSGFNIENDSPEYLEQMKKYSEYAHSKGLEIGGYSLLASRSIDKETDVKYPLGEKARFGNSPCIGSEWGKEYFQKLYHFYEKSGFSLLEHDGSYPGDICHATHHPGHSGYEDSRWNQYQTISQFYKWCRSQGIYLNIPDWYYLTGGNKCGMGYRETNWSLPREQQVIHTRQNIYDGTWNKIGSMGWMFVPLTEYHGGGAAATIEPLHEHLDHYEKMMVSNLSAGVQACYRGPRLFDTDGTKDMVKENVRWYKEHREVLEGDLIHLRRADGRDLDYWLMVNPTGEEKGALMIFNPTDRTITKEIEVPLYYTGLSEGATIYGASDHDVINKTLSRDYTVDFTVTVEAQGWSTWFIK